MSSSALSASSVSATCACSMPTDGLCGGGGADDIRTPTARRTRRCLSCAPCSAPGALGTGRCVRAARRRRGTAFCRSRARVRAQGVSEQDRARPRERCGRAPPAGTDARVLRLLRLAFVGTCALAARTDRAAVSSQRDCKHRPRGARRKPYPREDWLGADVSAREGRSSSSGRTVSPGCSRSPPSCAAGTIRRPSPGWRRCHRSRRSGCESRGLAAEALLPDPRREHSQTAFAFGLTTTGTRGRQRCDARAAESRVRDTTSRTATVRSCTSFGEDFCRPASRGGFMRRISPERNSRDGSRFLPGIPHAANADWLAPASNGAQIPSCAIDGLNLSRAWMLEGIASGLPKTIGAQPPCRRRLRACHRRAPRGDRRALRGGHWLGTFATSSRRGPAYELQDQRPGKRP